MYETKSDNYKEKIVICEVVKVREKSQKWTRIKSFEYIKKSIVYDLKLYNYQKK